MMSNLFSAEFSRLFRHKIFKILSVISVIAGIGIEFYIYLGSKAAGIDAYIDEGVFALAIVIGAIMAIFVSLFTGSEYSDGTIRNKLIMGHSRLSIYISKLITNWCAGLIFFLIYVISALIIGLPLNKNFMAEPKALIISTLLIFLLTFAYTAIFTAMSMCWKNRAGVAVLSLVICFILTIYASMIASKLSEPERYQSDVYISSDGTPIMEPEMPNPYYISGTKREVYEFLYDFLPSGQGFQLGGNYDDPTFKGEFAAYSMIIVISSTLIGIPVFKKKNIN